MRTSNKHYMVDISSKLDVVEKMVDKGEYFVINRPRQYGKTTIIYSLSKRLNKKVFQSFKVCKH